MKFNSLYIFLFSVVLYACSTSKNIPEGRYLLDKVELKSDNKKIDKVELETYLRQIPNVGVPPFGKLRLKIYNTAGKDTTLINRIIRKLGQKPVVYSPGLTQVGAAQIEQQLINQGYLNAMVDTILVAKGKKMKVTYQINTGQPYTIRCYELDSAQIPKQMLRAFGFIKKRSSIKEGELFNQEKLDNELTLATSLLRNIGYFAFSKEFLYHKADTTIGNNQVEVFLSLYPPKDSAAFKIHYIRNINIESGKDPVTEEEDKYFTNPDTVLHKGMRIVYGSNRFLKESTLARNMLLKPQKRYSDLLFSRTYSAFNGMGTIKQTNMQATRVPYTEGDTARFVDINLKLVPTNNYWFQTAIEGTNTAGNFGIAPNISFQNQNLLNGGEVLNLKLRGSYEFISGSKSTDAFAQNYYEYGGDLSLTFPRFLFPWLKERWREATDASTQFSIGLNVQNREEYIRQFFNATVKYKWSSKRNRLQHNLDLIDINYIRMPYISPDFQNNYLNDSNNIMFRTMYQDQLISRTGYSIVLGNAPTYGGKALNKSYTLRLSGEIGGVLPELLTALSKTKTDSLGQKLILGIAYAEYWKMDASFSQTHRLSTFNSIAYKATIGVANPFGNSTVVPFEKRYFSGGSNSVRGWNTRRLGPGSYRGQANGSDFINQNGDIKLEMSLEHRIKVSDFIELASFVDAGNIWTIKDYPSQAGGKFTFSSFYKEIASSYGLGLRFDMGFLLIRLDAGMKAYDPSRNEGDRWVIYRPKFNRDFAWHFAIGYPF